MVDLFFVNTLGLPVTWASCFRAGAGFWAAAGPHGTPTAGQGRLEHHPVSTTMVLVGFVVRVGDDPGAAANPPMNSNNPNNPHALLSMLNRDQYGDRPLLLGAYIRTARRLQGKIVLLPRRGRQIQNLPVITGYTHSRIRTLFPACGMPAKARRSTSSGRLPHPDRRVMRDETR